MHLLMRTVQEDTADGLPSYTHAKLFRSFYEILYSAHHVILRFSLLSEKERNVQVLSDDGCETKGSDAPSQMRKRPFREWNHSADKLATPAKRDHVGITDGDQALVLEKAEYMLPWCIARNLPPCQNVLFVSDDHFSALRLNPFLPGLLSNFLSHFRNGRRSAGGNPTSAKDTSPT
ncbi:hypothetical protein PsorP6_002272 [Peronosclerospora sorghi]|uniref:Uncharacterized protein n=1 Tax=Peronosclerospora sorghi TaxID=230839 RepID=A0ACC0WWY1_9STRA|nr:hypothetical protein PsorP6_002272 [Peronosclerospora sorghi]